MRGRLCLLLFLALFPIGCQPVSVVQVTPSSVISAEPLATVSMPQQAPAATPTATATNVSVRATGTAIATVTPHPTQTRVSATATPLPPISWLELSHDDFGVAWFVPAAWWEVSNMLLPASGDYSFWSAWASQEQADQLLSASPPSFPDGLMVLSLLVEPTKTEAAASGRLRTNVWGQDLRFQEVEDGEALPFALRLTASTARSPYKYTFRLGCAPPDSPGTTEQDAFMVTCRHIWDLASHNFGLCALPAPSTPGAAEWKAVGDEGYRYAFEVPAGWNEPGDTPDNLTFFSVPINEQPQSCAAPDQFMKVDFTVQPPGDFAAGGQPAQEGTPDVEGGSAITVAGQPAWLFESNGEAEEGGNFAAEDRRVYIQGPAYWYTLVLYCSPAWSADCETVWHHILQSFQISSP